MTRLNVIGGGRVGRALGRLWAHRGEVEVQDVLTRSPATAAGAVRFIGAGRPAASWADLRPADFHLVTPPDDALAACADALAAAGPPLEGSVVFHCSGALPSSVLAPAAAAGAHVAGVHPVKTFADPDRAAATFAGTYCGCEGDPVALERLRPLLAAAGAIPFPVDPARKVTYHAAAVTACNYLATLLATGAELYTLAGIPADDALRIMEPLVRETVDNVFSTGPAAALTGPVARGDHATVRRQRQALAATNPELCQFYCALGRRTVALARDRGDLDEAAAAALEEALDGYPPQ